MCWPRTRTARGPSRGCPRRAVRLTAAPNRSSALGASILQIAPDTSARVTYRAGTCVQIGAAPFLGLEPFAFLTEHFYFGPYFAADPTPLPFARYFDSDRAVACRKQWVALWDHWCAAGDADLLDVRSRHNKPDRTVPSFGDPWFCDDRPAFDGVDRTTASRTFRPAPPSRSGEDERNERRALVVFDTRWCLPPSS